MINLGPMNPKRPTKDRLARADKQREATIARRRYFASVKYCQWCGRGVYPNDKGKYLLVNVFDKEKKMELLVCEECRQKKD